METNGKDNTRINNESENRVKIEIVSNKSVVIVDINNITNDIENVMTITNWSIIRRQV